MLKKILSDSSIVFFGALISQGLIFIFTPLLTKYYLPENFGVFSSIQASAAIFSSFYTLRYNQAIMIPADESEAFDLLKLSIFIASSITTFFLLGLFFLRIIVSLDIDNLVYTSFFAFFIAINSSTYLFISRKGNFKTNSISKIVTSILFVTCSFAFGIYSFEKGLIASKLLGLISSIFFLSFYLSDASGNLKTKNLIQILKKYKQFPQKNLLPNVLNAITLNYPVLIVGLLYGINTQGQYGLTYTIIAAPLSLITLSIRDSSFKHFSDLNNKKEFKMFKIIFYKMSIIIFLGSIFLGALIFVLFPYFKNLFFDENWDKLNFLFPLLIFSSLIKVTPSSLSSILIVTSNLSLLSTWQLINFLSVSIFGVVLFFFKDYFYFEKFVWTLITIEIFIYMLYYIFLLYSTRNYYHKCVE